VKAEFLARSLLLVAATLLACQEAKNGPKQTFTGYPPSIYMQEFHACSSDPCSKTEEFRVDHVPDGCCVLTVTNGNGQGKNEVRSYEVFLNDQRVIPAGGSRNAHSAIKVAQRNTLRLILRGDPSSKVFILVAYQPRESK
jgi:hypothetical protein